MGGSLERPSGPSASPAATKSSKNLGLGAAIQLVRYRFFILAGMFPYLLGAAVAYQNAGAFDWWLLFVGLAGVAFISLGIEGVNEHFDSVIGGDRVFALHKRVAPTWQKYVGVTGFVLALVVALYLTSIRGWPVLCFAFAGAAAALSYLLPPVHLSYRGWGEAVIAASYGVGLTLGGSYLQAGRLLWAAVAVSLLPTLLAFAMSLVNEIPDFYGDRLVGKRNLVVRFGRKAAARLYAVATIVFFLVVIAGLLAGLFPTLLWVALLLIPLAWKNIATALRSYETPSEFFAVIRGTIILYLLANIITIVSYVWN
jgi:1,4-dihydroxy-2-naphthoate octaprenyltransferase